VFTNTHDHRYWELLSEKFLPKLVVECIHAAVGGAKHAHSQFKTAELQRMVAAATWDRDARREEYVCLHTDQTVEF
jgi:hypothetical protein